MSWGPRQAFCSTHLSLRTCGPSCTATSAFCHMASNKDLHLKVRVLKWIAKVRYVEEGKKRASKKSRLTSPVNIFEFSLLEMSLLSLEHRLILYCDAQLKSFTILDVHGKRMRIEATGSCCFWGSDSGAAGLKLLRPVCWLERMDFRALAPSLGRVAAHVLAPLDAGLI